MSHSPPAGVMADAMMDDPNDTASDTSPAVPVPAPVAKAEEQPAAPMHVVPANASSSPHDSDHSTYSGPMNTSYPSPTVMGAQLNTAPVAPMPSMPMGLPGMPAASMLSAAAAAVAAAPATYNVPNATPPSKAYPCGTCSKAFARRSDLARHGMHSLENFPAQHTHSFSSKERIHSGDRPHVCDFEGCGKQFIQRSALTVHQRVHTGEKPHLCERCGKVRSPDMAVSGDHQLTARSPSATAAPWLVIAGSIRAGAPTNVPMRTARRPSRVAPPLLDTRIITRERSRKLPGPPRRRSSVAQLLQAPARGRRVNRDRMLIPPSRPRRPLSNPCPCLPTVSWPRSTTFRT